MKKLILSFAVLATLAATSCGTSVKKAEDEGAVIKAKIENCTNPDSLKIYVQQAKDYAAKLVKDGDDSAAQAYLSEVAPVVQAKDPSAAGVFSGLRLRPTARSPLPKTRLTARLPRPVKPSKVRSTLPRTKLPK